jgi:hypothetical protein
MRQIFAAHNKSQVHFCDATLSSFGAAVFVRGARKVHHFEILFKSRLGQAGPHLPYWPFLFGVIGLRLNSADIRFRINAGVTASA